MVEKCDDVKSFSVGKGCEELILQVLCVKKR